VPASLLQRTSAERKGVTWHVQPEQPSNRKRRCKPRRRFCRQRGEDGNRRGPKLRRLGQPCVPDVVEDGVTRQHIIDSAFKMTSSSLARRTISHRGSSTSVTLQPPGCRHERLPPRRPPLAGQRHARLRQEGNRPQGLGQEGCRTQDNGPQVPDQKAARRGPPPARSRGRLGPSQVRR